MRVVTMDMPSQEATTKDNVAVRVDAVVYFKVVDPVAATIKVLDHIRATSQISLELFHKLLIESERNELINPDRIGSILQDRINRETISWGVEISGVTIKHIYLGDNLKCNICGKEVSVTKVGDGALNCCGQEMRKIE